MKKFLALLLSIAALIAWTSSPSLADVTAEPDSSLNQPFSFYDPGNISMAITGSLKEGANYTLTATGGCTSSSPFHVGYNNLESRWGTRIVDHSSGVDITTAPDVVVPSGGSNTLTNFQMAATLTAGAAGTSRYFLAVARCTWTNPNAPGFWAPGMLRTSLFKLTFEPAVGTASNFSVFPQAAGTAFTTWGVADGATSYTVTAAPGGRSCTTTQNFCTVTGLTNGETYTFTLTATNGTATASVGSGPVLLREPVTVGVGLNGGTWRVGESVTAQYVVQGSNSTPTITWYRCDQIVGAMPTAPTGCATVGSGTSTSYTLAAGDVGKYITAHVFVNNTDPQGQMTASSNQAVLASGAVAPTPVADPAGNPTIVNIPNPIVSVAGGTEVTITGTGLAGVTAVTVGGLPAIVVSKTDTTVVVQVPVSTKTGLADLTITNSKGSVTSKSAIIYALNPVIKITKTKNITGFAATSKVLTAAQKTAVKSLITANPTLTQLSCAAKTVGVAASKSELAKAKSLATAACAYAKTLKKTLVTSASASQTLPKSKASRSVLLTLKN
jgi:hypothetical protein